MPLENVYFTSSYNEVTDLIRFLMELALKINGILKFSNRFAEHFCLVKSEVFKLLKYYELESKAEKLKEWYGGDLPGQIEVYNSWSVIGYLKVVNTSFVGSCAYKALAISK